MRFARRDYSRHTDAELARAFRALAHPLRISALRAFAVAEKPLGSVEVAWMEPGDVPATTIRHHLERLAEAGVLRPLGPRSDGGVGRPPQRYVLTELGDALLPLLRHAAVAAAPKPAASATIATTRSAARNA